MIQDEFRAVQQRPEDVVKCLFAVARRGVTVAQPLDSSGLRFLRESTTRYSSSMRSSTGRLFSMIAVTVALLAELVASSTNLPFIIMSACWMDARRSTG